MDLHREPCGPGAGIHPLVHIGLLANKQLKASGARRIREGTKNQKLTGLLASPDALQPGMIAAALSLAVCSIGADGRAAKKKPPSFLCFGQATTLAQGSFKALAPYLVS